MACACKTQKSIFNRKNQVGNGNVDKKGLMYYLNFIFLEIFLKRILMTVLILSLCIFLMPLIIIILILTQILGGKARMPIPQRFVKYVK